MALLANALRVLRREGVGSFWRAFALRYLKMQPVPRAFVPPPLFDTTDAELAANRAIVERFGSIPPGDVESANWFVPAFRHPMAGVNNIFTIIRLLKERHGVASRLVLYGDETRTMEELRETLRRFYPAVAELEIVHLKDADVGVVPHADVDVATRWDSCYHVLRHNACRAKLYFIQDAEHLMHPAGVESALAEETYRFGFAKVCNTPSTWLATRDHGGPATWIHQPVDPKYNFPPTSPKPEAPVRVVFYGRPTNPRNGFGLGIAALRRVKERFGDSVDIVSMGEPWEPRDYGLQGIVTNQGVMDLVTLGEFYRASHIGLGIIFTRHPSLQPLEYWANGIAVVTNENAINHWIFRDGENCLTSPPSPPVLAERIGRLVEDRALRERLARAGQEAILRVRWETEVDRIWAFMTRRPVPERAMEL